LREGCLAPGAFFVRKNREESSSGYRHARLEQLLLEELRALLRDEATDPALEGVRLMALKLSVDYRHARVHFALPGGARRGLDEAGERAAVGRALARATPFLRARLADAIELKRLPDLRFIADTSAASELSELLGD
jgi:ribosome-binding factor A